MFELTRSVLVRLVIGGAVALLLTAGSCNDEPSAIDANPIPAASTTSTDPTGSDTASTDTQASSPATGSQEFQTIWGIPPFGVSRVVPGFGEYSVIDDDFQFNETVFFEIEGTTVDEVIAYYSDLLRSMGYTVGDPFAAGGSQVLSPNDGDPNMSAVLQVGPTTPGGSVLGINQGRTRIKTAPEDTSEVPPDESSDTTADAAIEGDE